MRKIADRIMHMQYTLLFPGEAYERALGHDQLYGQSPKDSLWAVYCRSLLLWCSSIRPIDDRWSVEQRSRSALEVLAETRTVQAALDMHQCNVDGSLVNVCKEYLYKCVLSLLLPANNHLSSISFQYQADGFL